MCFGIYLRNMGPASTRETIAECARAADASGIDDLWVVDHVAIPPDDAEGSGGRYDTAVDFRRALDAITGDIKPGS